MMRRTTVGILLLVLTFATGCTVGPKYHAPQPPVPAGWEERPQGVTSNPPSSVEWWKQFNDPVLTSLIDRAVKNNKDLRIAEARIREARAARGIAQAAALPEVGAGVSYERNQRSNAVPPFNSSGSTLGQAFGNREQNLYQAGFDARWEIDLFGGIRRDVEAARAEVGAAEENRHDVLVTLLAEVARNYVELRGYQQRLDIVQENLKTQQDTLHLVKVRFEAGLATQFDVDRAQAQVFSTEARVPDLERLSRQAMHRLSVLLGQNPTALLAELTPQTAIPTAPAEVPAGLPSDLLRRRPDVRRAERELAAATARIGVAKADYFPRFSLTGSFGRRSEQFGDLTLGASTLWGAGPSISLPIFTAGRIRNNVRVQTARQEQALARYEQAVLISLEDTENALVAYSRERDRYEFLQQAVQANRSAVELANSRYTGGVEDFLSVLDAQRSLLDAQDQLVQSERTLAVDVVALYKSLGGGWEGR